MAPLHAPVAIAAATHRNIETAYHGPPDDLLLILGFAAFLLHAAAMRAALWQWNGDSFIHARREVPTVPPAGFAAWALRMGFRIAARMRCGLALAGAQGGFQFATQTFRFLLQALDFMAQPFVFLLRLVRLTLRNELDALTLLMCSGPADWIHPTLR